HVQARRAARRPRLGREALDGRHPLVRERHLRRRSDPGPARSDAQLGRPWLRDEGLLLDRRVEHPDGLPARPAPHPRTLHNRRQQDRPRGLPGGDPPMPASPPPPSSLVAAFALLVPAGAFGDPAVVPVPRVPGAAALPGPIVDPGTPAANMKLLTTAPDTA